MLDSRWTDHADGDEERKEEQKRHLKRVNAGGPRKIRRGSLLDIR